MRRRIIFLAVTCALLTPASASANAVLTWKPLGSVALSGTPLMEPMRDTNDGVADLVVATTGDAQANYVDGATVDAFASNVQHAALGSVPVDVASGVIDPTRTGTATAVALTNGTIRVASPNSPAQVLATLTPAEAPKAIAIADVNGDGFGDVLTFGASTVRAYVNNGAGGLTTGGYVGTLSQTCASAWELKAADLDDDHRDDAVAACKLADGTTVAARLMSGGSAFSSVATVISSAAPSGAPGPVLELGDVDSDGAIDLVLSLGQQLQVYFNPGAGGFEFGQTVRTDSNGFLAAAIADIDHDGDIDIAALSPTAAGGRTVIPLRNNGNGLFPAGTAVTVDATASSIELLRLTNDQAPELVIARAGGIDALFNAPTVVIPSTVNLGDVTVGHASADFPVPVSNRGAGSLSVLQISTQQPQSIFTTPWETCTGRPIETGEDCVIAVRFTPTATGAATATLEADTSIPATGQNPFTPFTLNGTGVAATQGPQGLQGPQGPAGGNGSNGTNGTNGQDGAPGAMGATGAAGATGSDGQAGPAGGTGAAGPAGATGATGKTGATGPAGRDARVTCRAPKSLKAGTRKIKINCTLTLAKQASVALWRNGRVVARTTAQPGHAVRFSGHRLRAGRYEITFGATRLKATLKR